MSSHVLRAIRVLAPNDLRLIWRDGFLLTGMMVVLPLVGLLLRWLAPEVGRLVAQWVDLEPYYGLILANVLVAGQPVLLGFVIGMLFIEERDEGTLLALQASPLSLRTFLGYRLLVAMVLSVLLTAIGVLLSGLVSVSVLELLAAAALASLAVPMVALTYAVYVKNKVQALMVLKPVQIWAGCRRCCSSCPRHGSGSAAYPAPSTTPCVCSGVRQTVEPSGGSWCRVWSFQDWRYSGCCGASNVPSTLEQRTGVVALVVIPDGRQWTTQCRFEEPLGP